MEKRLTVLVVDDSAFARSMISKRLSGDPAFEKVETARDGQEALAKLETVAPDVVTMDVQMPRLDGLGALKQIMATRPTPVVMLSSLTGEDTDTTLNALELGAVDFFLKPSISDAAGGGPGNRDLVETVKLAARVPMSRLSRTVRSSQPARLTRRDSKPAAPQQRPVNARKIERVVAIASSTGGPRALAQVIPDLPVDDRVAYVIVQHMPAGFTKSLAERLDNSGPLNVREAQKGDFIQGGTALMAPGGHHMVVASNGEIDLTDGPTVHGVRPAADITMQSVARSFGRKSIGAVLTGMGSDGRDGSGAIKAAGGAVVAEDESSCVVYGMPRAVVDAGHADKVVPIHRIARQIAKFCGSSIASGAGAAD